MFNGASASMTNKKVPKTIQNIYEELLYHIVLPRVLPQNKSTNSEQHELALLSRFTDAIRGLKKWISAETVRLFDSFERIHVTRTPESISNEIKELRPGQSFVMFVRRQNCGFMIHMPNDENESVVVCTFPGNLHPKNIYDPQAIDFQCTYPQQAMKMKFSTMMRSTDFAKQLCVLYADLPIETKNRDYIHTWLMTILADENTEVAEFPQITKKIRDEVLGGSEKKKSGISSAVLLKSDYFRRSNFYMSMKVFLQLHLTIESGNVQGKLLYKIVMLNFLCGMCETFEDSIYVTLDIDLMTQFMAKIARRIEKLQATTDDDEMVKEFHDAAIEQAKKAAIKRAKISVSSIRKKVDEQIVNLETAERQKSQLLPLMELNFSTDVFQQVPNLRQHLRKRLSGSHQNMYSAALKIQEFKRHRMNESSTPTSPQRLPEVDQNLILTDVENWILYSLPFDENNFSCEFLSDFSMYYASVAQEFHSGDALGISKMLLVRYKLLGMIDRMAAEIHPLLLEHRTCIDTRIFDVLLLPHSIDMRIANELQSYFNRRNDAATKPSLISESEVTSRSFSVKFAELNCKMQEIRREILALGERNIEAKRIEWQNGRDKVERLRKEASKLECEYYTYYCTLWDCKRTKHRDSCSLCELNRQIAAVKVEQYERPLPTENSLIKQNSIVFELRIPIEISKLRDVLHSTIEYCHARADLLHIKLNWIDYPQIASQNESKSKSVNLAMTTSVSLQSHHVDMNFDCFIIENGHNNVFHHSHRPLCESIAIKEIKALVTLTVESPSKYSELQWTVPTTDHTQNQVLAQQQSCPQNLSLSEFKNFGSLRADGHRLQLRKLYAMIETEALSFDEMSVLSLVLQTIWETGVRGDGHFMRESFEDFCDPKFSSIMICLLDSYIEKQKDNWAHPIKLLIVAFIAVRLFELNDDEIVVNESVALLHKLRAVLMDWIEKIKGAVTEVQAKETKLRSSLAVVSITGAMTFFVNSKHRFFAKIFDVNPYNKFSAPRIWLQSIVTLNNNLLLSGTQTQCKAELRMFIRLTRNVGIHVEAEMQKIIGNDQRDVYELIRTQWTLSNGGQFMKYYFAPNCPQVIVVHVAIKGHEKFVTIDMITGSFLVNNLPVARLPENINKHPLFQRVFQQYIFEVQPDASNSFSTVHKYNICSYEFGWSSNQLIIKEHRNDGVEAELIPHEIFTGEIPYLLVENFSHWWNKHRNVIEIRPKLFADQKFSDANGIAYALDMNINRLMETKTQQHMLDINSGSHRKILLHLSRLEQMNYIHILMDSPTVAKIELVRMNLKFKIDCGHQQQQRQEGYDMLSNEFSRMRVSLEQNCGTLYGLTHGLLLENVPSSPSSKLLLLPHSSIKSSLTDTHISVSIDLDSSLRSPPFLRYQVDEFLQQLKASNSNFSAWFYLAYLHAITSHGEVESLTGMSGTERALQILQSSMVWSTAPYDRHAFDLLRAISNLSPKRRTTEDNFQEIEWPADVLRHSAHDTFVYISTKLIEESQRLGSLHFHDDNLKLETTSHFLNARDYLRCLPFKPNSAVTDSFIKHKPLVTSYLDAPHIRYSTSTRSVSCLYHRNTSMVPQFSLANYLQSTGRLDGPIHSLAAGNILSHNNSVSLTNLWITLYGVAREDRLTREQFALIWSLFVHEGGPVEPILLLQAIRKNRNLFANIHPPRIRNYITSAGIYDSDQIADILQNFYSKPSAYYWPDWSDNMRKQHDHRIKNAIRELTEIVTSSWPCDEVTLPANYNDHIQIAKANSSINEKLVIWHNNLKLRNFLAEISTQLLQIHSDHVNPKHFSNIASSTANRSKYEIDFEKKIAENVVNFKDDAVDARDKWIMSRNDNQSDRSVSEWWALYAKIAYSNDKKHLIDAGMYPRMVPSLVLPRILCDANDETFTSIIGALALAMAQEQRSQRIEIYKHNPQLKPALDREVENEPHINWKPSEYPEWLLFEIEQNLTIRRVQIEIAKRMIEPPEILTKHSVMQLNMGEGKTAVIVPIVAARLANGKQACQITVLKSLYATNLKSLRRYLGGMLNRRIYAFPCRRDMPIAERISEILKIYEECQQLKGVILTLPEYRCSFQLKIYELTHKNNVETAIKFLAVHKWINANVRSILDESDAILHAKYQLIYTVGNQQQLDGGDRRWSVQQALFKRIPLHMKELERKFGDESIEFNHAYVRGGHVYGAPMVDYRADIFTPCRILDETMYPLIKDLLIDDFIEGRLNISFPEMIAADRTAVRELLSQKDISTNAAILDKFPLGEQEVLLILSGLLRFEVLKLVLTRRWRVNYGVKKENGQRLMAVPFKAKDVAAELTEFGHPDVALGFTHLSYYYSGLTDTQLQRVFQILSANQNPEEIYEKWITSVPEQLLEPSIKTYSGINLSDPNQREQLLFPLLRFNMHVIDFWLSSDVFPREAKTFENKLICTAWDLCSDHMEHRVTGFSGTNDTKNILPLPITQNDLKELEQTNEQVRQVLLQPENRAYEKLQPNVSAKEILTQLANYGIPVLLDAGALMLELNNEQVAKEWLLLVPSTEFDAAVFFDTQDVLQTVDRNGIMTEFDCSVYRENLTRCLVYLDDVHTRGTDLKFPLNWRACVTLSGDIARDKTVQACMRMRQLGIGHCIAFWASHEANIRLREVCNLSSDDCVRNEHVLEFICANSKRFEMENTVHWAAAAFNYTKKLAGHKMHEAATDRAEMVELYEKCVDDEFTTLTEMYGDKSEALLSDITTTKFDKLFATMNGNQSICEFIVRVHASVVRKIKLQAPQLKRFQHTLDEEQEKELEHELEEQRQVERPPQMDPAVPIFDQRLIGLFSNALRTDFQKMLTTQRLITLSSSLSNTSFFRSYANDNWSTYSYVTRDFVRVLQDSNAICDDYLRPVWWIAFAMSDNNQPCLILLSSYECDRLMPVFRTTVNWTLCMYRPRLSKFHTNLLNERRLQVTATAVQLKIDLQMKVQIGMYSGSMYFESEAEQNEFCNFLGIIPRPRKPKLEICFEKGIIKPNGFVPSEYRAMFKTMFAKCGFTKNPTELAMKLIAAHHQNVQNESHVASILQRGTKLEI